MTLPDRSWWRLSNAAGSSAATLWVYDEIGGWGITAADLVQQIANLDVKTIELRLNSPGGIVFDGIAIYNALRAHPATVNVTVDGLAASIASVIMMAGDSIVARPSSQIMIHDAEGMVFGNAAACLAMADLLGMCSDNIAGVYATRAGGTADQWRARMRDETWYSAAEALAAKLVDSVDAPQPSPAPPTPEPAEPASGATDGVSRRLELIRSHGGNQVRSAVALLAPTAGTHALPVDPPSAPAVPDDPSPTDDLPAAVDLPTNLGELLAGGVKVGVTPPAPFIFPADELRNAIRMVATDAPSPSQARPDAPAQPEPSSDSGTFDARDLIEAVKRGRP